MKKRIETRRRISGWVVHQPSGCLLDGVKSVNIFNDLVSARRRIVRDGIQTDWQNVGSDLRFSMFAERARREREAQ